MEQKSTLRPKSWVIAVGNISGEGQSARGKERFTQNVKLVHILLLAQGFELPQR